jgi:hypothetical protein
MFGQGMVFAQNYHRVFTFVKAGFGAGCGSVGTCTASISSVGEGHLLAVDSVAGTFSSAGTGVTASDGTNTYTLTTPNGFYGFTSSTDHGNGAWLYSTKVAAGSYTVSTTWTTGGTFNFTSLNVLEFSYSPQFPPLVFDRDAVATFNTPNCNSPVTTPSITPSTNNSLVIGEFVPDLGGANTAGAPWTTVLNTGTPSGEFYVLNNGGTVAASFNSTTTSGDSCGALIAAFH